MSTLAEATEALRASLAAQYPTHIGVLSNRPGAVTCAIAPASGEWEPTMCDPQPGTDRADIMVLAASASGQGIADLIVHKDPVAALIRAAGWLPLSWAASDSYDLPSLTITAETPVEA